MNNQKNNYIKKIDHYYLKTEISKSEKSTVYLAIDNRNDKLMSVKAFKNKDLEKNNRNEKLRNEIEILLKLKNKNIIRLKNFKKTKNNSYLITEYCNGGNLKDFLLYYKNTKKTALNELIIQKIIRQVASGLEYIHSKNIIHRDLTLDNLLLNFSKYQNIAVGGEIPPKLEYSEMSFNDSFTLKISDLDYSKDTERSGPAKTVIGTAKNMAPDIVKSIYEDQPDKTYNSKIDLWSLGTITYELLTGQTPFSGKNSEDTYKKIIEGKYNFPSNLVVSVEIISFINGLLQFCPEKRMDWPQIKNHPFLKNNVDSFNYIELNIVKDENKNDIEINTKDPDNLLWIIFRGKNGRTFDLDKLNIYLSESQIKEMEEKINENKVDNDEIKKAVEEKKKNIEEDKERLKKQIEKAQKLIEIAKKKISEVYNIQNEKKKNENRIKELDKILNGNINESEKQKIKNEKDKLLEEIKIIDNFKKEDDKKLEENEKLLKNAEKIELDAQKDLINIKLKELFNPKDLSLLKTEKDIIRFFKNSEKDCEKYFFFQFGRNEFLKDFWEKSLEEIFKTNVHICEITKGIYSKLEEINKDEIQDEEEYNEKIYNLFPDMVLPDFLIAKDLKSIRCKVFPKKRNILIKNIVDNILMKKFTDENMNIIELYENIKNNEINVFNDLTNKNEIFNLLIIINNSIFNKSYYGEPFSNFLKNNENLIKQYFGDNIKYDDILGKINNMNENEKNTEKDNLFKKLEEDINLNTDKLYTLISSLYYIFNYKFKDTKINKENNFGNIFINLILKNFVIFLDEKFAGDFDKNLLDLLNLLYLSDICKTVENKKTNNYTFEDINNVLKNSNENLFGMFEEQKTSFWQLKAGPCTILKKNLDQNLNKKEDFRPYNNIILKSLEKLIYSTNITIIVDFFSDIEKNQIDEWRDFIGYFKKETMFYFFNWSCITKDDLLQKGNVKKMNNRRKDIDFSIKTSKICGKILAYILISNKFFPDLNINLIGFGLGCNVVKHCIKEMHVNKQNNSFINLKNVILIGGATHLNKKKWKIYIEDLVADKFINCYSSEDEILKNFNEIGSRRGNKKAIGIEKLDIKNEKDIDLVINHDFSEKKFDQLSYKLKFVVETIFGNYKDI